MSQSVDILIKADDKASQKVADAAINVDKSLKRVEQITTALETPTEKYNKQLEELILLHENGAMSADQLADAEGRLRDKIESSDAAMGQMSGKAKSAANGIASLASMAGSSELAGFARSVGTLTENVSQFGEVSKAGGAGAAAFKVGLVGLAASIGFGIGKALADIIWQTDKFERSMAKSKEQAKELDDQLKSMQSAMFSRTKEDIELIQDPDEKRSAYNKLLTDLDRDINSVSGNVRKSKKDVEEWAEAWQITGNRKQYAIDAGDQLAADKEKLASLKSQREEIEKVAGARALENDQIRQSNEAKDKSADYLEKLKLEVEYLAATREEQLKLDAARNTTAEDRGEAERLLKERDAIIAKTEAAKELEQAQKKAQEEAAKAAEKAKEDAAKEIEKVVSLIASEKERMELQRIEIQQGKEAAKIHELIGKGVDEATARQLASDEASLDKLKHQQDGKKSGPTDNLQASESRLLTRGSSTNPMDETNKILQRVNDGIMIMTVATSAQLEAQQQIASNTANTIQVTGVP